MVDKRSHARFPVTLEVTLIVAGKRHLARTRDVSPGGMFVYTDVKIPFGTEVQVQLIIPALKELTTVDAVARWHDEGGLGVSFKGMRARSVGPESAVQDGRLSAPYSASEAACSYASSRRAFSRAS